MCSELGMVKAIFESRNAKYGRGDGLPIWLSKVNCVGEESSLADCPHPGWGNVGSCTHGNDAGVKCLETGGQKTRHAMRVENYLYFLGDSLT